MKALLLLENQHRKVEALFDAIASGEGDPRDLVVELATNLAAHMLIEQEIFYPAVQLAVGDQVLESYEEHAIARYALVRLLKTVPEHPSFQARALALKRFIAHHVAEEEDELFPQVAAAMNDAELEQLGAQLEARFIEVLEQGYEAAFAGAKKATALHPVREVA